eukprot:3847796-Rhodomonas_salina.9
MAHTSIHSAALAYHTMHSLSAVQTDLGNDVGRPDSDVGDVTGTDVRGAGTDVGGAGTRCCTTGAKCRR